LLKNVQIQQRIVQLQQKVARKAEITLESLLREAAEIQTAATNAKQYAAANSALKLKAELSGHYVQRKEDVTPRRSATSDRCNAAPAPTSRLQGLVGDFVVFNLVDLH
jgi:cell division septum initiation protein DivIVA